VGVVGESLGSGPASILTSLDPPPDKLVLVVPFDQLALVAKELFPSWLVGLMLTNDWDNVAALKHYQGPVQIFGAESDEIIPVTHAKALAAGVPGAKFTLIKGGHNEWSHANRVTIRNP
jgi:pimeloyl-ACP methyl ester carboxylesterase